MASMRTHLKEMHANHATFHIKASKSHAALAKCFGKMTDVEGSEDVVAAHQELAKAHEDAAAVSVTCAKGLDDTSKGMMDDGDLRRIVPDNVHGLLPDPPAVRAVLRTGQRPLPVQVDPQFEKLVSVGDE
jgi:hypothetical protein